MSCFVQPTVQNLKMIKLQYVKMKKAANSQIWESRAVTETTTVNDDLNSC